MLTSDLSIVRYERGRAIPDRLGRARHARYRKHAGRMLEIYRSGTGRTRAQLHREVEEILADESDCPSRRIGAFKKLLDEAGRFETDRNVNAGRLRLKVFEAAARHHPLVAVADRLFEGEERVVKASIAEGIGMPWQEIERRLYADVMENRVLLEFEGYADPAALLSRYNVAQLQAALYRAERLVVSAEADFKTILRYAKLARLLHEIRRTGPSRYELTLAGPASVLRETRRYGIDLARFLPALLACRDWECVALLRTPRGRRARLELTSRDGFTSHLPSPEEFDSSLEESFAETWGGGARDGWTLQREAVIVQSHQTTFVPDFVFRHEDGTEVLFEIVGYWTPEYLAEKRKTLRRLRDRRVLLAVPERSLREGAAIPEHVLVYKTTLKLDSVLQALERFRQIAALESATIAN